MVSLSPPLAGRTGWRSLPGGAIPALAALAAFAVAVFAPQVLNDGDSWWHVAAGGWMLDHGRVIRTDVFSYTFAGQPWHAHEWLAEVVMALAYRAGGWSGVVLLFGAAAAAAMAILARRLERSLSPLSLALTLLLAFGCMSPSFLARPHLLALPLLAAWTDGLLCARETRRSPPIALAALMTLWANVHGGYLLGLALIGPFALEALIEAAPDDRVRTFRDWAAFGFASLLAALVTPFGVFGLLFPFQLLGMTSLAGVTEWRPVDFSGVVPLEVALVAGLFVMLQRGVRVPPLRLALVLLLLHMALHHQRHQILLAVTATMVLAEPLGRALSPEKAAPPKRRGTAWAAAAAAALVLAGVRLASPVERTDSANAPVTALQHVPPALRAQPVFNAYGFGGYLISQGVKTFIDGRTDMFGDGFNDAYFRASRPDAEALDQLLKRWRVAWTLLPPNDPVVGLMDKRPGWRRLYADGYAVIHVREGALAPF
jgi:hypothetical protein